MSGSLLPHALLDFTLARASARLETLAQQSIRRGIAAAGRRHAHQSALLEHVAAPEYAPFESDGERSLYSRRQASRHRISPLASVGLFPHAQDRPMTELERRISDLKEVPVVEAQTTESVPSFSEGELLSMYEDLLSVLPPAQQSEGAIADPEALKQTDEAVLRGAIHSLYALEDSSVIEADATSQYTAAISKLQEIIETLEGARGETDEIIPVQLLSEEEWVSLVRTCVSEQDGRSAETVLDLLRRSGSDAPLPAMEPVMAMYAEAGDVTNAERFLEQFCTTPRPERFRDLHIKAHLRASEPRTFPTTALSVLHNYETIGLPAPQRSYGRLITTLLSVRSTIAESQAWDLFAHMRYVAHPIPDAYLYTTMIAACASRVIAPQPARALDLFTEMTVDKRIAPTTAAYTAAIYACSCSGEKLYVGEAFRLAREMLDGHRDAYGQPALVPDRRTFCALLEGAKRVGDLAKVRWILAEIVAESMRAARGDVRDAVVVDEEIMTHVFHAYATYKVPFVRGSTVLLDKAQPSDPSATSEASTTPQDLPSDAPPNHAGLPATSPNPKFSSLLPQSAPDVIAEVSALFHRITSASASSESASSAVSPEAFRHVQLTPRLLNAYLSVYYAHAPFTEGSALHATLFDELSVPMNAWTHVEALERATRTHRRARADALAFARRTWAQWKAAEGAWRSREEGALELSARLIERAYVAMIRTLSLSGKPREALQVLREFVTAYPPQLVKKANPKHELRSTRTVLEAARPLVRMMSPTELPDDTVPPMLTFSELEILHSKLVDAGDEAGIAYVKYVCVSYGGALVQRKKATLHAKPAKASAGGKAAAAADE